MANDERMRTELAAAARRLYVGGPLLARKLQHWRPLFCPFERLLCHVPAGSSVLDAGCGAGLFLALLVVQARIARGLGIDVSPSAIEAARRMAVRARDDGMNPGSDRARLLEFQVRRPGDFWPDGRFDVVGLIDVLHHVPRSEQERFIRDACARVGPGGRLIYKDMGRRPFWRATMNRVHDLVLSRQWINYVPVERVADWAAEEGLRIIHADSARRLWYAHEIRVFERGR